MNPPKKIRARRMWSNDYSFPPVSPATVTDECPFDDALPVLVLPGSAEAVERMVEQGVAAMKSRHQRVRKKFGIAPVVAWAPHHFEDEVRCVLASLGITAGKKRGTK